MTDMKADISPRERLTRLALDMSVPLNRASSSHLWSHLNPELWRRTRNAWAVLQTVSDNRLEECLKIPSFYPALEGVTGAASHEEGTPRWFDRAFPENSLTSIAYFSMEFMLGESLPIYSGGLGNVAGDQLKAASDLGVPVTGIGLLYSQGYFRQELDRYGSQIAMYPFNDPGQLPIQPGRTQPASGCASPFPFWDGRVTSRRFLRTE